jgi:hypothetical protein
MISVTPDEKSLRHLISRYLEPWYSLPRSGALSDMKCKMLEDGDKRKCRRADEHRLNLRKYRVDRWNFLAEGCLDVGDRYASES